MAFSKMSKHSRNSHYPNMTSKTLTLNKAQKKNHIAVKSLQMICQKEESSYTKNHTDSKKCRAFILLKSMIT